MSDPEAANPAEPFFLVVADHDQRVFSIERPMTVDGPWLAAALRVRDQRPLHVVCGPRGTNRASLVAKYRGLENMTGVRPGSIVRPRS